MLCRRGLFSLLQKTSTSRLFSTKGQRVIISEFGNDPIEALENHYRVEEFECPDPGSLGPNDVLIKIKACAVSWVDMLMTSGQYQHQPKPPYTPGQKYSISWVQSPLQWRTIFNSFRLLLSLRILE